MEASYALVVHFVEVITFYSFKKKFFLLTLETVCIL